MLFSVPYAMTAFLGPAVSPCRHRSSSTRALHLICGMRIFVFMDLDWHSLSFHDFSLLISFCALISGVATHFGSSYFACMAFPKGSHLNGTHRAADVASYYFYLNFLGRCLLWFVHLRLFFQLQIKRLLFDCGILHGPGINIDIGLIPAWPSLGWAVNAICINYHNWRHCYWSLKCLWVGGLYD